MKKLILVFMCLAPVLCAVSCAGAEKVGEYVPGVNTEDGYSSDWLGMEFAPTENLYLATSEEIEELLEISADMLYVDEETGEEVLDWARVTTVYEMMATDEMTGDSVIVMAEKIGDTGIGVDEYIEVLKTQINTQLGVGAVYSSAAKATVAGQKYTRFAYTLNFDGVEIGQTMYLRKQGDRMIAICVTAENEAVENAIISCFKAK